MIEINCEHSLTNEIAGVVSGRLRTIVAEMCPPKLHDSHTVTGWCEENGYTDLFFQDGRWWAFPPNAVMPVAIDLYSVG